MAQHVVGAVAEAQKQPGGEAGRAAGIGLRLVAIDEERVEHMRAEAGFGGMTALAVAIAEERVQPAVAAAAVAGKVVDQLDMAVAMAKPTGQVVERERGRMVA